MDKLAEDVKMSSSSFYRNFKKMTGISPLQYQKRWKLTQAKNLYSQVILMQQLHPMKLVIKAQRSLSRKYKKMLGKSPKSDIKNLIL